jgi:hypothetical protein
MLIGYAMFDWLAGELNGNYLLFCVMKFEMQSSDQVQRANDHGHNRELMLQ